MIRKIFFKDSNFQHIFFSPILTWFQLLFGSGVLVSLSLSGPQLEKVVIDRSLVGKLISDTISDGNYNRVQINCLH